MEVIRPFDEPIESLEGIERLSEMLQPDSARWWRRRNEPWDYAKWVEGKRMPTSAQVIAELFKRLRQTGNTRPPEPKPLPAVVALFIESPPNRPHEMPAIDQTAA